MGAVIVVLLLILPHFSGVALVVGHVGDGTPPKQVLPIVSLIGGTGMVEHVVLVQIFRVVLSDVVESTIDE